MNGAAAGALQSFAWRLETYDSLGSTSDACVSRAVAGEAEGLAIRAIRQISGRGSRGRSWHMSGGDLALSVLLRPRGSAAEAGHWALLAAVAAHEAVSPFVGAGRLELKWPNDLLLGRRKLGGVLIDSALAEDGALAWLVIGIGINVATKPVLPGRPTACLRDLACTPDVASLADALLQRLALWRSVWLHEGFEPIRSAWLARALPLGTACSLQMPDGLHEGRFAGLSMAGELVLECASGRQRFATGEVLLAAS